MPSAGKTSVTTAADTMRVIRERGRQSLNDPRSDLSEDEVEASLQAVYARGVPGVDHEDDLRRGNGALHHPGAAQAGDTAE